MLDRNFGWFYTLCPNYSIEQNFLPPLAAKFKLSNRIEKGGISPGYGNRISHASTPRSKGTPSIHTITIVGRRKQDVLNEKSSRIHSNFKAKAFLEAPDNRRVLRSSIFILSDNNLIPWAWKLDTAHLWEPKIHIPGSAKTWALPRCGRGPPNPCGVD